MTKRLGSFSVPLFSELCESAVRQMSVSLRLRTLFGAPSPFFLPATALCFLCRCLGSGASSLTGSPVRRAFRP